MILRDVATRKPGTAWKNGSEAWTLGFAPDSKTLATGDKEGVVRLWSVESGEIIHTLNGHDNGVRSVTCTPDGKTLASTGMDRTVRFWQVAMGQELISFPDQPAFINSPDGTFLAAALHDGTIRVWRAPRGQ